MSTPIDPASTSPDFEGLTDLTGFNRRQMLTLEQMIARIVKRALIPISEELRSLRDVRTRLERIETVSTIAWVNE